MVLRPYVFCPTKVVRNISCKDYLPVALDGRDWAVVTSRSWATGGMLDELLSGPDLPKPIAIISEVSPNPTLSTLFDLEQRLPENVVVVALGGGSVMDMAKGMLALKAVAGDQSTLTDHLKNGVALPNHLAPMPMIAIPTTSGTGSEVTQWGTIWGDDGIKFSVTHPSLFPQVAILDEQLCVSMGADLTLATGLDALSHAMESVWNHNHSSYSDGLSVAAIKMIRRSLETCMDQPHNLKARKEMQEAAILSGLAMGATQTALAHSISYPFTSKFGMPHGLACSFTLPEVARFNSETALMRLQPIAEGLEITIEEIPDHLYTWFRKLGVPTSISKFFNESMLHQIPDNLITRARAANNIRPVEADEARLLAAKSLQKLWR